MNHGIIIICTLKIPCAQTVCSQQEGMNMVGVKPENPMKMLKTL